jgi:hypothetical protein
MAKQIQINELPIELDPDYVAPDEPMEVTGRRPQVGEWLNCHRATPNGDEFIFRATWVDGPLLARVERVTDEGCLVQLWSRPHMNFIERFFAPWCCILSRTQVNHYSLPGNWPAHWLIAA